MTMELNAASFKPGDPDNLRKLTEICADIISTAMSRLKIDGVFMVIVSDDQGNVHLTTDVSKTLVAEFAQWATQGMDDPAGRPRHGEPLQ